MRYIHQPLVRDRSLILSVEEELRQAASEWMPSIPEEMSDRHPDGASLRLERGGSASIDDSIKPSLMLGDVRAWVRNAEERVHLTNSAKTISGDLDLSKRVGTISVPMGVEPSVADVTYILAISAALLLVRDGRTPVHAGGVVQPRTNRAWLLVGDTHTGKSTTTANLMKAGWSYLSDDYVVLTRGSNDSIEVEGWPDDFHLDEGFHRGESTGVRGVVKESDLPSGSRIDHSVLDGILFTRINADAPTAITRLAPVAALERLIRQSPWLVADSTHAGNVFQLLSEAASHRCGELTLGRDTLADSRRLDSIVSEFALKED